MLRCTNCGEERPDTASICPKCGTAAAAPTTLSPVLTEQRAIEIFVGKNHGYYAEKWAKITATGKQTSWNWPAFLLPIFWFPYRKMYIYTALGFSAILIESMVELVIDVPDSISRAISIGLGVAAALMGNQLYRMHVQKQVRQILARQLPEAETIAELTRSGGTSVVAAIAAPALFIAAMFAVGWFGATVD